MFIQQWLGRGPNTFALCPYLIKVTKCLLFLEVDARIVVEEAGECEHEDRLNHKFEHFEHL